MKHIVIFASGSGTNAENIIKYFQDSTVATVIRVLSNKKDAKVLNRANKLNVKNLHFNRKDFFETDTILNQLVSEADIIVLAGFLWKVPQKIIKAFPNKIINIHPALLPNYGGKGMYGMHIHEAIVTNQEKETGITIHYVNENYDEGAIIFQEKVALTTADTPEMVAAKIHKLEQENFPKVIEKVILENG